MKKVYKYNPETKQLEEYRDPNKIYPLDSPLSSDYPILLEWMQQQFREGFFQRTPAAKKLMGLDDDEATETDSEEI